jgi:hypothetical protein
VCYFASKVLEVGGDKVLADEAIDRNGQMRGPGESYSDVIFRLASPNAMSPLLRPR